MTPKIREKKTWYMVDVKNACVNNDLYKNGDNKDFDKMLQLVKRLKPTTKNIYRVAKDICEHSEGQDIENIMFILANVAVMTTYEIEDGYMKENLVPMPGCERLAELAKEYE